MQFRLFFRTRYFRKPSLVPEMPFTKLRASGFKERRRPWPCGRSLKLHGSWLLRIGVIVKSASRLSSMPSREDHALQQGRRGEALLLEFVEHDLGDVIGGVQPHKIQQR